MSPNLISDLHSLCPPLWREVEKIDVDDGWFSLLWSFTVLVRGQVSHRREKRTRDLKFNRYLLEAYRGRSSKLKFKIGWGLHIKDKKWSFDGQLFKGDMHNVDYIEEMSNNLIKEKYFPEACAAPKWPRISKVEVHYFSTNMSNDINADRGRRLGIDIVVSRTGDEILDTIIQFSAESIRHASMTVCEVCGNSASINREIRDINDTVKILPWYMMHYDYHGLCDLHGGKNKD